MDFHVLIVSRNASQTQGATEAQNNVLGTLFSDVDSVLLDRAFTLNIIYSEPNSNAANCVTFQ